MGNPIHTQHSDIFTIERPKNSQPLNPESGPLILASGGSAGAGQRPQIPWPAHLEHAAELGSENWSLGVPSRGSRDQHRLDRALLHVRLQKTGSRSGAASN